ncbi:MAG: mechanosensitive ion channel family protein [Methanocalculus sp. MSAO_Arc1]|uniref:mechanosensitive ion channel family protein n=1 Tax=unclassified Methanocalculus TaxID=2631035 RepID=UPI000FF0CF59|nr:MULTISPECIES: mechanosensitive ion channel domain-containing protein [unclassified Methanocalculus]MCP1661959.1 small-conductance mechanosensitive channel [Methanocalculus sp. AMF5]RQD80528.1 MAG: mechanosensitive ion channel family protein [Methanocalculus sp. MSAO_Arc1]
MIDLTVSEIYTEILPLVTDAVLIFIGAYIIARIISFLLLRLSERFGHARIAVRMIVPILNIIIYTVAIMLLLHRVVVLGTIELVAFSGLFGAAIGFGLKDVFANIIGGVIIAFEKPFRIGDRITMGEYYGEVVEIGMLDTRIVTPDDNYVTIPNYKIFTQSVASANAGLTEMMVTIDIYIDHAADIDCAIALFRDAVVTSRHIYISDTCFYTILTENQLHAIRLRARAYVWDLRDEFECKAEISRRTKRAFQREGILPPRLYVPGEGLHTS